MFRYILLLSIFPFCSVIQAQTLNDLSFGSDSTLEVMTWNIEEFPKRNQKTVDYVKEIIEALDVDIIGVQEIEDTLAFNRMINELDLYEGSVKSSYYAGLGFIYKPSVVKINDIYEIYTTSPYWKIFPRSPLVMDFNYNGERFILINNHLKCCGNGILDIPDKNDEETRRYQAMNLIKDYLDLNFPNDNTIVIGDLNDVITDKIKNNVFKSVLSDPMNYLFADNEIANSDDLAWSYPKWPSHIDHIIISNELFDEFESEESVVETIEIDFFMEGGWYEYEKNVSDHRPVAFKLGKSQVLDVADFSVANNSFSNYPNPFYSETTFYFFKPLQFGRVEIFDVNGTLVFTEKIHNNQSSFIWNPKELPSGVYFARIIEQNHVLNSVKLFLLK